MQEDQLQTFDLEVSEINKDIETSLTALSRSKLLARTRLLVVVRDLLGLRVVKILIVISWRLLLRVRSV